MTSLGWLLHNLIAHPVMGVLEFVGDMAKALGCPNVALWAWYLAGIVHTSTVPTSTL